MSPGLQQNRRMEVEEVAFMSLRLSFLMLSWGRSRLTRVAVIDQICCSLIPGLAVRLWGQKEYPVITSCGVMRRRIQVCLFLSFPIIVALVLEIECFYAFFPEKMFHEEGIKKAKKAYSFPFIFAKMRTLWRHSHRSRKKPQFRI